MAESDKHSSLLHCGIDSQGFDSEDLLRFLACAIKFFNAVIYYFWLELVEYKRWLFVNTFEKSRYRVKHTSLSCQTMDYSCKSFIVHAARNKYSINFCPYLRKLLRKTYE